MNRRTGIPLSHAEQEKLGRRGVILAVSERTGVNRWTVGKARQGKRLSNKTLTAIRQALSVLNPTETKPHWTQLPENKAKLRRIRKQAAKTRNGLTNPNGKGHKPHAHSNGAKASDSVEIGTLPVIPLTQEQFERHLAYLYGRTHGQIAAYCESIGVPVRDVAYRVGTLLQSN